MQKSTLIVISIFFVLVGILFPGSFVWAQENGGVVANATHGLADFLHLVISILSRVWVLIASLAGKLMTNDIVYGEFIHLDSSLWKLWNVVRSFANFLIGFLFILLIIKFVFTKDGGDPKSLFQRIFGFVVAAVAVQMSYFLVGATIDLSTILTISIGSFPSMVLDQDVQGLQSTIAQEKIYIPKTTFRPFNTTSQEVLDVSPTNEEGVVSSKTNPEKTTKSADATTEKKTDQEILRDVANDTKEMPLQEFLDLVTPRHDSLAGPLLYIGVSIFKIQNYMQKTTKMSNDLTDILMTVFIKAGMLIFFTFALLLILVFNVIRVVFLWIFIALSPIFILFYILKLTDSTDLWDGKMESISIESIVKLIFAPVLFTAYISLMFIMVVTMQRIIGSNETDGIFANSNVKISGSTVAIKDIAEFSLDGDFRSNNKENVQTTISDIILMLMTMFMLRGLVYMIKKTAEGGIGGDAVGKAAGIEKQMLQSIPIGNTSFGGLYNVAKQQMGSGNLLNSYLDTKAGEDKEQLNDMMGRGNGGIPAKQEVKLKNMAQETDRRTVAGESSFLSTLHEELRDAKPFKGSANLDSQGDIAGRINTRGNKATSGAGAGQDTNWKKYLYHKSQAGKVLSGKRSDLKSIKNEDIRDLGSMIDQVKTKVSASQYKQFLKTLFFDLTGKEGGDIKDKKTFMKAKFGKQK